VVRLVLPAVTGLRGVAAGAILLFHVEILRRTFVGDAGHVPLLNHGWAAVDLFFVLSAFLLGAPFLAAHPPSLGRYFWRRFARVVPPYWASVPVALVANAIIGAPAARWRDLWTHATFLHSFFPDTITTINSVYWTLAVEAQIYLALPVLALLLAGPRGAIHVVWLAAVTFTVRALALDHFAFGVAAVNLPGFLLHATSGLLAAKAWARRTTWERRDRWLWWAAAALLLVPLAVLVPPESFLQGRESWLSNLVVRPCLGVGFALVVLASCRSRLASRILGSVPFAWLGERCYSVFLLHLPILGLAVWRWGPGWPSIAAGVLGSLAAAFLFHAAIELPSQRWSHAPLRQRSHGAEPL
jgi:peptidoglycan/LPS O-acetylase OafA/YrhL